MTNYQGSSCVWTSKYKAEQTYLGIKASFNFTSVTLRVSV